MKKLIMLFVVCSCTLNLIASPVIEINEKVKKSFKETFPDAKEVSWSENGDTYQVRFFRQDIDTRVVYETDGTILSTIRYYQGKYLPAFLLSKLNKKFSDKKIHLVTELNSEDGLEYHITLHDEKRWYVVKAYAGGSMTVYDKYYKQ
jgi:hypothetical protein